MPYWLMDTHTPSFRESYPTLDRAQARARQLNAQWVGIGSPAHTYCIYYGTDLVAEIAT